MSGTSQAISEDGTKSATLKLPTNHVRFDREKTEQLRTKYDAAIRTNKLVFDFEGNELLTAYAGYMLEYLDAKFGE